MIFQASVGIDIQDRAIVMAYLKASVTGVKLLAHGVYSLEDGQPGEDRADRMGRVVKAFFGRNRIPSATLFLGIPREAAILRYVELPLVVKENLRDSLGYELEKYMPFSADELYFDYQVISEDKNTEKLQLLLVAVKREFIEPFISLQKLPGARLSGVEVSSTAVANFFSSVPGSREKDPYVLIYARENGLEIDLLKSGFLAHSRPIALSQGDPDLPTQVSQQLKKIKETLKGRQGPLKTIVCTMERENALAAHLKEDEAFDVRLFDFSSADVPSTDIIPAYGLALKGLQDLPMDVNLLPREMRKKPSKAGYYVMFGLAGVVIFLTLAWTGGMIFNTQRYIKHLDNELNRLETEVTNVERIKAECVIIGKRIDFFNPLRRDRLIVLNVIKELSERIPKSAWLLRLTYSDSDNQIQIEGWADSASGLIPLLDDSPLFKEVKFLSSITTSAAGKERFRVGLQLDR